MPPTLVQRRQLGRMVLGGSAALALWGRGPRAQTRNERPRVTIAVDGRSPFALLPLVIAEQLELFKAEGLDVAFNDLPGNGRALQALLAGQADLMAESFDSLLALHARGRPLVSIVQLARAPQVVVGVSTRTLASYRDPSDLRGRRVGVVALGSNTALAAAAMLARAGLGPADVSLVGVGGTTGALTAMRTAQVDAISHVDPAITMLEQRAELRIISDTRTLKGTLDLFGGPMPSVGLGTTADYVQRHPGLCQSVTNAVVQALKWLQTAGPSDIIKTVPDAQLLGDRALYLAAFGKMRESISVDGVMPADGPATAARAWAALDPQWRIERVELARTFTNEFSRRAKDRYKA